MSKIEKIICKQIPDFKITNTLKHYCPWGRNLADLYLDQNIKKFALIEKEAFGLIIKSVDCYSGSDIEECDVVVETAETTKAMPNLAAAAIGGLLYGLPGAIIASQMKKDRQYITEPHRLYLGIKIKGTASKVWRRYFWTLPDGIIDRSERQAIARQRFDIHMEEAQHWKQLIDTLR